MYKKIDAFAKPRQDLRQKSALGGLITLVASVAAGCLFLGQMYTYITGVTRHSLHLSRSQWVPVPPLDAAPSKVGGGGRIALKIHVSFPHLPCSKLDLTHDGVSHKDSTFREIHGKSTTRVAATAISKSDWEKSTGIKSRTPMSMELLRKGCTYKANFDIPKVGGSFTVGMNSMAWSELTPMLMMGLGLSAFGGRNMGGMNKNNDHNVTHYIHSITFGDMFPLTKNPLENDMHLVHNEEGGIALASVDVKLIPTQYSGFMMSRDMYQLSVTEHIIQPATMGKQGSRHLPGLAVTYDFTPLAVHHVQSRDNPFVFFSSLVSIVGGVFVTVSLVTGCLVHSAAEIAKKID